MDKPHKKSQFDIGEWHKIHGENKDENGEKKKMTAPSAEELDDRVNDFISHALQYRGKPYDKKGLPSEKQLFKGEDGKLTELDLSVMFEALMKKHAPRDDKGNPMDHGWDEKAFAKMFNKFEDDDGEDEDGKGDEDGMDRGEVSKMLRYICGL